MRFGHLFDPMNFDASRHYEAIEECLFEAELVEQLGFDAIWIAVSRITPRHLLDKCWANI